MAALDHDAPFVVANSPARITRQAVVGAALLVLGVALAVAGGGIVPAVAAVAGLAVLALSLIALRHREPVLAADRDGVAMQAFRGPDGVRRLAWADVEAVYVHRIGRQFRMLCIAPRDLDAERAWAGEARVRQLEASVKRVGAPYSANLVPAGLRDDEALATLAGLGAPVRT